jgi:hypothetical protein
MTSPPPLSTDRPATPSTAGRGKVHQAHEAFVAAVAEATQRGFYGTVSLTLTVQDGHVQQVRIGAERTLR